MNKSPVIVALDYNNDVDALNLVEKLLPHQCRLKVGKELFTSAGPQIVKRLVGDGFDVFLDLKFHDIPNTVGHALKAARDLGVWMVNVHASGGIRMMESARAALMGSDDPLLIAVTVLTSMGQQDLDQLGIKFPLEQHISHLAGMASDCGLDGVVCSAREVASLRQVHGVGFCLVTPGIRPAGSDAADQCRIVTPEDAISLGSDFLVIGRPITQSADPAAALQAINATLFSFLSEKSYKDC